MSTAHNDQNLTKRFRFIRRALGVSSLLLLVLAGANFFGWLSPYNVPDSLLNSLQYLLVALVILLSIGLQRSGNALHTAAQEKQEGDSSNDAADTAPVVLAPSGPKYARARKRATIFQVTAILMIAGSLIAVPMVGDLLMSSGAPFAAFNAVMIGIGVVLITAAAASKYFTHKARKAGRQSIKEQEESLL
jgi:protein-S-isoprenylcysteine O-methyltransferase Ste14